MTGVQTCALPICFPVTIGVDGRYQGEIVQEGLYTYLFRYENRTGNRIRRNTIKEAVMVLR